MLSYSHLFLTGLLYTVLISVGALIIGTVIGFLGGFARSSSIRWLSVPVGWYVEVTRSIPLLIFLFMVYYGLPTFLGIQFTPLFAAILAQGCYLGAYMTEVVRSGIQGVPRGQWQASEALGLTYWTSMRSIIVPQALRILVPPAIGLLITSVKDSSLASVIGVMEMTQTILTVRQQTYSTWAPFLILLGVYLVINLLISSGGSVIESRLSFGETARS